ncbi:MAG: hypothetical protein AB1649_01485 [Chloroflexota bacterium]
METDFHPTISSFVIRFVIESSPSAGEAQAVYRGLIRHVQSAEELNFHEWTEAVDFMRRFVQLDRPLHDQDSKVS